MNPKLDSVDVQILDALSDDYESVEQIHRSITPDCVAQEEIISRLERLHAEGYVTLIGNKPFDREAMLKEISETKNRAFWFSLTAKGNEENAYKPDQPPSLRLAADLERSKTR